MAGKRMTLGDFLGGPPSGPVRSNATSEYCIRDADDDEGAVAEGVLTITGTKKGSLPVGIEKRAKGKKVRCLLTALISCHAAGIGHSFKERAWG